MMTRAVLAGLFLNLLLHFSTSLGLARSSVEISTPQNATLDTFIDDRSVIVPRGENGKAPTCLIGDQPPSKRHAPIHIEARAPTTKAPIKDPPRSGFARWISGLSRDRVSTRLQIVPSKKQRTSWTIDYGKNHKVIPIGATGVWFPFTNKAQTFFMTGLTGCTGIIIVSSRGIYAAHLWEGAEDIGGPSSFQERIAKTDNQEEDNIDRPRDEFQAVAVDIFDIETPAKERKNRPLWKSLGDIRQDENDPFRDGRDTQIFILSKTEEGIKEKTREPRYPEKVEQLAAKFKALIPGAKYTLGLYQDGDPTSAEASGTILVQYSPYDRDGGDDKCTPQSRVRMFYENHKTPVLDKLWDSTPTQIGSIRKRDSCAKKPTPSSPPSTGGTCKGTTNDKSVSWSLTINVLFRPDECTWAEGGFGDCFPSDSVDGADDCGFSSFKHTCGPSDHPGGLVATFKTNTQCDPKIITDCIHSTLYPNGTVDACEK